MMKSKLTKDCATGSKIKNIEIFTKTLKGSTGTKIHEISKSTDLYRILQTSVSYEYKRTFIDKSPSVRLEIRFTLVYVDDNSEANRDLISDTWGDGVLTASDDNLDVIHKKISHLTKEKFAETVQKSRSLIRKIRQSQVLTTFFNSHKRSLQIVCQLSGDCITRWNSTYVSIKSFLEHKVVLLNLFENKSKLSLTSAQQEKIKLLELSSDEWTIIVNLISLLEPFYYAINMLSGSNYPTIGLSLFAFRNIKDFLESESEEQSDVYTTLKRYLLDSFNDYFNGEDDQYFLLLVRVFILKFFFKIFS